MATLLSNIADDLTERIHKIKCKDYDCFLEYESVKDNLTKNKCLSCHKDYSNKLDKIFKKDIGTHLCFQSMYFVVKSWCLSL